MARRKPLSQLGQDLRSGLALSTELVARNVTLELKQRGPYWTGQFEKAWEVEVGQVPSGSILRDAATMKEIDDGPKPRQITPVFVPPADDRLVGYTISNLMEYAAIAMDLKPGDDGMLRHQRPRATAEADWFENYLGGGAVNQTIASATRQAMGMAGFKR